MRFIYDKVAAVQADSYDPKIVGQAIADLLTHSGGISQFIQPGDRVLVKPNMLEVGSIFMQGLNLLYIARRNISINNLPKIIYLQAEYDDVVGNSSVGFDCRIMYDGGKLNLITGRWYCLVMSCYYTSCLKSNLRIIS